MTILGGSSVTKENYIHNFVSNCIQITYDYVYLNQYIKVP